MRHPPRSVLLSVTGAVALVTSAVVPVASAREATPARTVEYTVTGQWAAGFQGSVRITNDQAAPSTWKRTFGSAGGRHVTQGRGARWSRSGTTVTAADETWNGTLGTGASAGAGFPGSWPGGGDTVPSVFKLDGTTCDVGSEPATSPPTTPPPSGGTAPAPHVVGDKLVAAGGAARRLLGVDRSGGEFMCVRGRGIRDGPVDDAAVEAIADRKANAVGIPLNEECRPGLAGIAPRYGGAACITAVRDPVGRAEAHGMTPVLEPHWSYGRYTGISAGCSDVRATCRKSMPDMRDGPTFRASAASAFEDDPATVFDPFDARTPARAGSSTRS